MTQLYDFMVNVVRSVTPTILVAATAGTVLIESKVVAGVGATVLLFLLIDLVFFRLLSDPEQRHTPARPISVFKGVASIKEGESSEKTLRGFTIPSIVSSPGQDRIAEEARHESATTDATLTAVSPASVDKPESEFTRADSEVKPPSGVVQSAEDSGKVTETELAPPASKGFRLVINGKTCFANNTVATDFENEFFKGKMMFLMKSDPPDPKFNSHFEGKSRMFELQMQGRLKLLPQGEVSLFPVARASTQRKHHVFFFCHPC
ncbi:unnamed protein product [Discosporangium mesarthrocarpum]